jgi:DNA-binding NarL/FixJ family response regulator
VDVIARAGSVRELIAAPGGAVPQVILLGVPVPGGVGAALQALCAAYPHGRILMLSASECRADIAEAFRMGAHGYLHRNARADELIQAVRSTFQQERYLSPALGAKLLLQDGAAKSAAATPGKVVGLSTREAEILCMLRQGLNNKLIAARLGLSDKTVKHYMTLLFQKLGVRSRLEAALIMPPSAGYGPALQRLAA